MAIITRFRDTRAEASWMEWVKVAVAVWLFISPWVLVAAEVAGGNAGAGNAAAGGAAGAAAGNAGANVVLTAGVIGALSWNAWIAAVLLACLAIGATAAPAERRQSLEWQMVALGAWLFVSPWVLGFAIPQLRGMDWNYWGIGALTFFLSAIELGFVVQRKTTATSEPAVGGADLRYAGDRPQQVDRESRL